MHLSLPQETLTTVELPCYQLGLREMLFCSFEDFKLFLRGVRSAAAEKNIQTMNASEFIPAT